MTQKELIIKLIEHYEMVYMLYDESNDFHIIQVFHCSYGVCNCAEKIFKEEFESGTIGMWYDTPDPDYEQYDNLRCLMKRINRLQKMLNILNEELKHAEPSFPDVQDPNQLNLF